MGFYLKRTVARDTPADLAWRAAYRRAVEQATAEASERYPVITSANFKEAVQFKDARLSELIKQVA
jgi:hypothetical protein